MTLHLKDGGDGAGTMPALKMKKNHVSAVGDGAECDREEENDDKDDHMFQYGIIPLKMVDDMTDTILWQNKVPNSARSLRPIFLIREKKTNANL